MAPKPVSVAKRVHEQFMNYLYGPGLFAMVAYIASMQSQQETKTAVMRDNIAQHDKTIAALVISNEDLRIRVHDLEKPIPPIPTKHHYPASMVAIPPKSASDRRTIRAKD